VTLSHTHLRAGCAGRTPAKISRNINTRHVQVKRELPPIKSYHNTNQNIHKFTNESKIYTGVELSSSHTYILPTNLVSLMGPRPSAWLDEAGRAPMGCETFPSRRRAPGCHPLLFHNNKLPPWRAPPTLGCHQGPGQSINAIPVLLKLCDSAQSQPQTTTTVCCPEWHQGRSTLQTLNASWRLKHADWQNGEASRDVTVLELRPSRVVPMVRAVDCPTGSTGPIELTSSARQTPCCWTSLQAKYHPHTCHSMVSLSSGAVCGAGELCCGAAARHRKLYLLCLSF